MVSVFVLTSKVFRSGVDSCQKARELFESDLMILDQKMHVKSHLSSCLDKERWASQNHGTIFQCDNC